MKIIVRVRELRKNHNLTQEELARQLNISRQSLISLEQGRWLPSLPLAIQLAEFFNSPLEDVIDMPAHTQQTPIVRETHQELERVLDQTPRFPFGQDTLFPTINVKQDEANVYLEAHLPGYTQDQIDIDVAEEFVTISGNAASESADSYLRQEYYHQSFTRTLSLPFPVLRDDATAKMANGILTITLPKVKEEKPKTKRLKPTEG